MSTLPFILDLTIVLPFLCPKVNALPNPFCIELNHTSPTLNSPHVRLKIHLSFTCFTKCFWNKICIPPHPHSFHILPTNTHGTLYVVHQCAIIQLKWFNSISHPWYEQKKKNCTHKKGQTTWITNDFSREGPDSSQMHKSGATMATPLTSSPFILNASFSKELWTDRLNTSRMIITARIFNVILFEIGFYSAETYCAS